jgi:hypothetical protein
MKIFVSNWSVVSFIFLLFLVKLLSLEISFSGGFGAIWFFYLFLLNWVWLAHFLWDMGFMSVKLSEAILHMTSFVSLSSLSVLLYFHFHSVCVFLKNSWRLALWLRGYLVLFWLIVMVAGCPVVLLLLICILFHYGERTFSLGSQFF